MVKQQKAQHQMRLGLHACAIKQGKGEEDRPGNIRQGNDETKNNGEERKELHEIWVACMWAHYEIFKQAAGADHEGGETPLF